MAAPRRKKAAPTKKSAPAKPASGPVTLTLPGNLGYVEAGKLHEDLLAVQETPEVVLDASGVERLSTAAVLVLISFLNARTEITPPAAVVNPPGPFVDAFSNLGLFDKLMRMEFKT